MFSLDGMVKYWLYNKPVDMRKSFNGLTVIVINGMCANVRNGDVYIFINVSRNMMKMLRWEEGGSSYMSYAGLGSEELSVNSGLNVPLAAVCNVPAVALSFVPPQKWSL